MKCTGIINKIRKSPKLRKFVCFMFLNLRKESVARYILRDFDHIRTFAHSSHAHILCVRNKNKSFENNFFEIFSTFLFKPIFWVKRPKKLKKSNIFGNCSAEISFFFVF